MSGNYACNTLKLTLLNGTRSNYAALIDTRIDINKSDEHACKGENTSQVEKGSCILYIDYYYKFIEGRNEARLNLIHHVTEHLNLYLSISLLLWILVTLYKKIRNSQEILVNQDSGNLWILSEPMSQILVD